MATATDGILSLFAITDQVAFVTGGSQGLGRAICVGLAEAGADIVAAARSEDLLEETARQVHAMGRRCLPIRCDVTIKAQVDAAVDKAMAEFGRIDILVNTVGGVDNFDPIEEISEEDWDRHIDWNLKGAFLCTQKVGKVMLKQGKGKIVNIGSINAFIPFARSVAPYNVAKAGLNNFTKQVAEEWGDRGIWANCIAATGMNTPGSERALRSRHENWGFEPLVRSPCQGDQPPIGSCLAEPELYVPLVLFLASPASNHLTGDILSPGGVALRRT